MSKRMGKNEVGEPSVFFVNSEDHGPADVARASGEGKILKFSVEKFVEVPEGVYRDMSRGNQEQYNVTRQLWRDWLKSPREAAYGERDIIQVHSNNAKNRMAFAEKPEDAHVYYASMEQAYSMQAQGYKFVPARDSKFKPLMPERAPDVVPPGHKEGEVPVERRHYVYNRESGKPELVAMYIPEEKYQRHIHARAVLGHKKLVEANADFEAAKGEVAAASGEERTRYRDVQVGRGSGMRESKVDLKSVYPTAGTAGSSEE